MERGADVHAKKNNGATALILASQQGNTDIVRMLIQNATKEELHSALILAIQEGHTDIVRMLIQNGAKEELD